MSRNGKPIDLILQEKKTHLTKAEIEARKASEIKIGTPGEFICPDYVLSDEIAYSKWQEITAIFQEYSFVTSADSGIIARYCKTFSEYRGLLNLLSQAETVTRELAVHKAINQKMSILAAMDDRLFLSPLARAKNVPKKVDPEPEDPLKAMFGDI